ncbi:Cysteine-rich PDZ-binding protein, partial [Operophtera brumata]
MVCDKCEKKLGRVITPDPWKTGARNTVESGGRKVGENKALTASKASFNIKRQYGNNEDDVKGNRNNYFIRMGYTNKDNPEKNNRNNDKKSQKAYNRNYLNTKIYERNHYNGKDNKNEDFYDKISNRNDNSDVKDYRSDYNDNIDGTNHRKNWRGSCSRNAAKACKKACVTAHTN